MRTAGTRTIDPTGELLKWDERRKGKGAKNTHIQEGLATPNMMRKKGWSILQVAREHSGNITPAGAGTAACRVYVCRLIRLPRVHAISSGAKIPFIDPTLTSISFGATKKNTGKRHHTVSFYLQLPAPFYTRFYMFAIQSHEAKARLLALALGILKTGLRAYCSFSCSSQIASK